MKVAVAWSGGKDSCYACYKAINAGYDVTTLLVTMSDLKTSNFHMIGSELLDAQSEAMGIPIIKCTTTPGNYEQEFKKGLEEIKNAGIEGLVTGDVFDVAQHESGWLERVCGEVGLKPIKPLWHLNTKKILEEFIDVGFRAIVVRVNTELLGLEWLGREVNHDFLKQMLKLGTVDPCGEHGEFHTFVTSGPLFENNIEIVEAEKKILQGYGLLEIKQFNIKPKSEVTDRK